MNIQLISYEDKYAADFKRLNLAWLEKYHLLESHDLEILDNVKEFILDRDGAIYLAQAGETIVGAAALMKEEEGVFELVKLAVDPAWQGKGISKLLMDKCMETARLWNVKKLTLWSNSQLQVAISLYEKYGFHHVKPENSPYVTANVRMELDM